ncbi:Ankyrin repeat domain-containing protein 17 [Symbiodinium microadriaticum]|uniref:Leucine-rich repeat and WD repeat-containing protein 1 n=1 Tax=Symbiodinium microadriaticum TaxID=2951 RepID=A0A1Q9CID3_SYMMI|nr:Ankyrin repeat domain-containing protein 17 [Symbiodinium microadriaticum]
MALRVWSLSGEELASVSLEDFSTVRALKGHLRTQHGFPVCLQQILHDGQVLQDATELRESHSELQMMLRSLADVPQAQTFGPSEIARELVAHAKEGNARVLQLLLQARVDIELMDQRGDTALAGAAGCGHVEIVHMLLAARADIEAAALRRRCDTPLIIASEKGRVEVVRLLLESKANKEAVGRCPACDSALLRAALKGHTEIVRLLLDVGVNKDFRAKGGDTALIRACMDSDNTEIVRLLLQAQADVEAVGSFHAALGCASVNGHVAVLRLLLEARAKTDVTDKDLDTPLMSASEKGHTDIVRLLLEAGAEKDCVGKYSTRDSALGRASAAGHTEIARLLLDAGAEKDFAGGRGDTPLIRACDKGHAKIVSLLLEARANKELSGRFNKTALMCATEAGDREILHLLSETRDENSDLTKGTFTGGIFTAVAYAVLLLLLIAELGAFIRKNYQTNVVMDQNNDELIQINFDILMYDLPSLRPAFYTVECRYLKIGVWDKFGEEKINSTDQQRAQAYTKEEIALLEQADTVSDVTDSEKQELDADWSSTSDHLKHQDFKAAVTFHEFTLVPERSCTCKAAPKSVFPVVPPMGCKPSRAEKGAASDAYAAAGGVVESVSAAAELPEDDYVPHITGLASGDFAVAGGEGCSTNPAGQAGMAEHPVPVSTGIPISRCQLRRVIVNQDASPIVALAAEARHSEIIGQLSMEHHELLRAEMGQGEAKFHDTEYAKQNALIEASIHASNVMKAAEEIKAQRDHSLEVETSARRADEARSHEVASLSFRVEEMMKQMQAQFQQTQSLLQERQLGISTMDISEFLFITTLEVPDLSQSQIATHLRRECRMPGGKTPKGSGPPDGDGKGPGGDDSPGGDDGRNEWTEMQEGELSPSKSPVGDGEVYEKASQALSEAVAEKNEESEKDEKLRVKESDKVTLPQFPQPESYSKWRLRVREAVFAASDRPDDAFTWLSRVWEKDVKEEGLRDPEGFVTFDGKVVSGVTNILEGAFATQINTFKAASGGSQGGKPRNLINIISANGPSAAEIQSSIAVPSLGIVRKPLPKPDDDKNITMDRDGAEALARGLRVNGELKMKIRIQMKIGIVILGALDLQWNGWGYQFFGSTLPADQERPLFRREGLAIGKPKSVKMTGGDVIDGRVYDAHEDPEHATRLAHPVRDWTISRDTTPSFGRWLYLYDGQTMRQLSKFRAHKKAVNRLLEGPAGSILTASADGTVRLWKQGGPKEGSPEPVQQFEGHMMSVSALDIVEEWGSAGEMQAGTALFTGSRDCSVMLWDLETGRLEISNEIREGAQAKSALSSSALLALVDSGQEVIRCNFTALAADVAASLGQRLVERGTVRSAWDIRRRLTGDGAMVVVAVMMATVILLMLLMMLTLVVVVVVVVVMMMGAAIMIARGGSVDQAYFLSFTGLDLCYCELGALGVEALAASIARPSGLRQLSPLGNDIMRLGANAMTARGACAAASLATGPLAGLKRLDLEINQLGDEVLLRVSTTLQHLVTEVMVMMMMMMMMMTMLTMLMMLLMMALLMLAAVTKMTILLMMAKPMKDLGMNSIGRQGALALAEALGANTALTRLDLGYNRIGSEGAEALAHALMSNTTLKVLRLEDNAVGDLGAAALVSGAGRIALLWDGQELSLRSNGVGSAGGSALVQALRGNWRLTALDVTENAVTQAATSIAEMRFPTEWSVRAWLGWLSKDACETDVKTMVAVSHAAAVMASDSDVLRPVSAPGGRLKEAAKGHPVSVFLLNLTPFSIQATIGKGSKAVQLKENSGMSLGSDTTTIRLALSLSKATEHGAFCKDSPGWLPQTLPQIVVSPVAGEQSVQLPDAEHLRVLSSRWRAEESSHAQLITLLWSWPHRLRGIRFHDLSFWWQESGQLKLDRAPATSFYKDSVGYYLRQQLLYTPGPVQTFVSHHWGQDATWISPEDAGFFAFPSPARDEDRLTLCGDALTSRSCHSFVMILGTEAQWCLHEALLATQVRGSGRRRPRLAKTGPMVLKLCSPHGLLSEGTGGMPISYILKVSSAISTLDLQLAQCDSIAEKDMLLDEVQRLTGSMSAANLRCRQFLQDLQQLLS